MSHLPSVSMSTARFWKISMWLLCAMLDILGLCPFALMNWIAWVPTYITRALIMEMLYRMPGSFDTWIVQGYLKIKFYGVLPHY